MTSNPGVHHKLWLLFSGVILLGAFLMFLVQPLVGKIVTPQYGGGAQVWCVCLLFFQLTLLAGYGLTYGVSKLPPRMQAWVYIGLMAASLMVTRIPLGAGWAPGVEEDPVAALLVRMAAFMAMPVVLLSTVSTTFQNWYRLAAGSSPYQLYSISNIGSMAALLVYPTLLEPAFTIGQTVDFWMYGYRILVGIAVLAAGLLLLSLKKRAVAAEKAPGENAGIPPTVPEDEHRQMPQAVDFTRWILLSAMGTVLLLSITRHIIYDIAPVPLLWILPLSTYLLTFILCFGKDAAYSRGAYVYAALICLGAEALLPPLDPMTNTGRWLLCLFVLCMICHGEIYHSRPRSQALPAFYLAIAFGGALGGVLVNLLFPALLDADLELWGAILLMLALCLFLWWRHSLRLFYSRTADWVFAVSAALLIGWYYGGALLEKPPNLVSRGRNFYGSAYVVDNPSHRALMIGGISHGGELIDPETGQLVAKPIMYFSPNSAVGIADTLMRERRAGQPLKVGVIGLGVGAVAAYGKPGDDYTFYEIDPKVVAMARNDFTYLQDTPAATRVIMGDGRLALQVQPPQQYDILMVDAFTSDSIPIHLLTREAMTLYQQHIKPDGLIILQLSNRYLALKRVTGNLMISFQLNGAHFLTDNGDGHPSIYSVATPGRWFTERLARLDYTTPPYTTVRYRLPQWDPAVGVWTDDYSNLLSILTATPGID